MSDLGKKRNKAALLILGAAGVGGFATFAPTPVIEVPKQVVLGAADLAMCVGIYHIYFEEMLSESGLLSFMQDVGFITVGATGAGYLIAKGASGIVHEVANVGGPLGWALSGAIALGGTALLGGAWLFICDKQYRERLAISTPRPS
jgi:hypothetical protein